MAVLPPPPPPLEESGVWYLHVCGVDAAARTTGHADIDDDDLTPSNAGSVERGWVGVVSLGEGEFVSQADIDDDGLTSDSLQSVWQCNVRGIQTGDGDMREKRETERERERGRERHTERQQRQESETAERGCYRKRMTVAVESVACAM